MGGHLHSLPLAARCCAEAEHPELAALPAKLLDGRHRVVLAHRSVALVHNHARDLLQRAHPCSCMRLQHERTLHKTTQDGRSVISGQ